MSHTNLQQAIKEAGLTQAELARRLNLGEAQLSRWCRGVSTPGLQNRQRLSFLLGWDEKDLFKVDK